MIYGPQELERFAREALLRGLERESIRKAMTDAGWTVYVRPSRPEVQRPRPATHMDSLLERHGRMVSADSASVDTPICRHTRIRCNSSNAPT